MTSPELGIAAQDNTAMAGHVAVPQQAGVVMSTGGRDDAVERAFEAAVRDAARLGELLDALVTGRLWVPVTLGASGRRALAEGAVRLPTVRYLGDTFVPGYTSAARLLRATEELIPGERVTVIPHAVLRAADLARRLPAELGIALNPGGPESVPVYPPGVAHLAAEHVLTGAGRVSVGPVGVSVPGDMLGLLRAGLAGVRAVRQAALAWLAVERRSEGLVISVTLDDPGDAAARDAAVEAVQQAVTAAAGPGGSGALGERGGPGEPGWEDDPGWPRDSAEPGWEDGPGWAGSSGEPGGPGWPDGSGWPGWSVDVTFPGEGEPDFIDRWVAAHGKPFYQRPAAGLPEHGLPAPRPASS